MRKEVAFAIFAGIGAGLFLAFGVWKLSSKVSDVVTSPEPSQQKTQATAESEKKDDKTETRLTITSPKTLSVWTDQKVVITGHSAPLSSIVIVGLEEDSINKTGEDGNFTIDFSLVSGLNRLNIFSFTETGELQETSLDAIYSSEFLDFVEEDTTKTPIAYTGSITDITERNIQIKADDGSIKQLTTAENATFSKIKRPNNTSETIKLSDLAIGDYIIAMGFAGSINTVLDTKRIIVDAEAKNENTAMYGIIADLTKKKLTLTKLDNTEIEITLPKTWTGPDVSDMEENQKIIVTGSENEDDFNLRSILTLQ